MEETLISNEDTKDLKFPMACTFDFPDVEDHIINNTISSKEKDGRC